MSARPSLPELIERLDTITDELRYAAGELTELGDLVADEVLLVGHALAGEAGKLERAIAALEQQRKRLELARTMAAPAAEEG